MSLLTMKIRGFRVLDMIALGLLIALILSVYLAKTFAGKERAEIATVERQIGEEHDRIRLLQAEVSHLERPDRITQLSTSYLGLAPISAKREATPEGLSDAIRAEKAAAPGAPRAPVPAVEAPAPVVADPGATTTAVPAAQTAALVAPVKEPTL